MFHTQLVALLMQVLAILGPGYARSPDALKIVEATADTIEDEHEAALEGDAGHAPIFSSYVEDAVVQVYWAVRESSLNLKASGDGGKSKGAWQQQSVCGEGTAWQQATCWRALLRRGRDECPLSPGAVMWGAGRGKCSLPTPAGPSARTMANRRTARARELLQEALVRKGLAQRPPRDVVSASPNS